MDCQGVHGVIHTTGQPPVPVDLLSVARTQAGSITRPAVPVPRAATPGTGHLVFAFVIFFNGLLRALARYLFIDTLKRLYFFYQTTKNPCKSTSCTGFVTHEHDGFSTQL